MSLRRRSVLIAAALGVLLGARVHAADGPLLSLEEGGRTFVYRSRPGDSPSSVAAMFGIPPNEMAAFLATNHITDATRVASGFVYRVPNLAGRGLAEHAAALERDNERLSGAVAEAADRASNAAREARQAREGAAGAEARATRLEGIERWWFVAELLIVLLLLGSAGLGAVAVAALRRQRQADRYARTLAAELEDKRRANLTERQESARRILDLETRVRELESKLGPRVVVTGRSG